MQTEFKEKRGYNYELAQDAKKIAEEIVGAGMYNYIDINKVAFIRSLRKKKTLKSKKEPKPVKPRGYIARTHTFGKIWQNVLLGESPSFLIEVASENYDNLSNKEKERTILHELYHIPNNFEQGKLRLHDEFHNMDDLIRQYNKLKTDGEKIKREEQKQ